MAKTKRTEKASLKIDKDLHHELKIRAAKEGRKLEEVASEVIEKGLEKGSQS